MDRRTVLLGSGTALALTLAGCMGGDDDPDEPRERTRGETGDDYDDDDYDDGDDDLPGFDEDELAGYVDRVDVKKVERVGGELIIDLEVREHGKQDAVEELGHGLQKAVKDVEHLREKVHTLTIRLFDDGVEVLSVSVDIEWLRQLVEEEIDVEEFADRIREYDDD